MAWTDLQRGVLEEFADAALHPDDYVAHLVSTHAGMRSVANPACAWDAVKADRAAHEDVKVRNKYAQLKRMRDPERRAAHREACRKHHAENRERHKARCKAWRAANQDKVKEHRQKWTEKRRQLRASASAQNSS